MLMQALTAKVSKSGVIAMEHPKEDIIDDLRASCLLSENPRQFYSNVNTLRHIFPLMYGVNLIKINRIAPSSKTCGQCGYVDKGLKLSERSWTCPECGTGLDRDFNAACNIKEFSL